MSQIPQLFGRESLYLEERNLYVTYDAASTDDIGYWVCMDCRLAYISTELIPYRHFSICSAFQSSAHSQILTRKNVYVFVPNDTSGMLSPFRDGDFQEMKHIAYVAYQAFQFMRERFAQR